MKSETRNYIRPNRTLLACALASCLAMVAPVVLAQTTTATIRGRVNADSAPAPNARITATNTANGAVRRVATDANGNYALAGLQPGTYRIDVDAAGKTTSRVVSVQVGQAATLDLQAGGLPEAGAVADATTLDTVTVVGTALIETKTSEVATNVTTQQIATLPQNSRNFLNFAALAPGISTPRDPNVKQFSAAGQRANQTNVFIDGASQKNNILEGGLVGQDGSKGNPFSQEAVQEFRVLTQNFKAEYEQAGSATITAITKSGSNDFSGSIYGFLQTKGMRSQEKYSKLRGEDKVDYRREQYGATVGGPIIKDRLFYFLSYEATREDGSQSVSFSNPAFQQYNGTFAKPFEQDVWFGKISWAVSDDDNIDISHSRRRDTEVIGFGGNTAYEARTNRDNSVDDTLVKWRHYGDNWINEASLNYGEYLYTPNAAEPDLVGRDYQGAGRVGGGSNLQIKEQKNITFRNDLTFSGIQWNGDHVIKTGIKFARYEQTSLENGVSNPVFTYDPNAPTGYAVPARAVYAPVGLTASIDNNQFGIFIQDDWDVNSRLQLNLGLRWDYESDANNKNYVTPAAQRPTLNALGLQDYISDGNNRDPYKKAFQPRLGFSYDFSRDNDQSWVVFGGAGRYYDRTPLDYPVLEQFRSQSPTYNFTFSLDGAPGTILWNPSYLSRAGLDSLITGGNAPGAEIILVNNDTRPPYSDQFNLGLRRVMGDWTASATVSSVKGRNQFTYIWANRQPVPGFVLTIPPGSPYGVVIKSTTSDYDSNSLFFTLDKPYTKESGWSFGLAYTYQDSKKEGGDRFSLDWLTPDRYPDDNVGEKQRLVMNGIVDLPWDFKFSGLISLGSGEPYNAIYDFNFNGGSTNPPANAGIHLGATYPQRYDFIIPGAWAYRQVDLSLSKEFKFGDKQALELRVDAFNVLNYENYGCYTDYLPDPRYGQPNCTVGLPRSFQVGARYRW